MSALEILGDVAEFLEGYSDVVDGDDGAPAPNKAMSLLGEVEREIENLQRAVARPEGELLAALKIARLFIRRSQIEHAVVDMDKPNVGIGEYLDGVIERHAPQKDDA